ncbi:ABC transporter permease [Parabacteroides sp. PF5-9]|uniref:ABC transporter permease n=1 Tax=Parabacteroides sp. PF5-9 TaxID=1742404 RepID=UPI0024758351|nr:ABC transporter permease [Parabacteroides sp. PF5-9]MDH6357820.1 hypothetical protein [Parabacteroides sp. PF5-9]
MIKQILKIIWSQRKSNIWIFAELTVVVCAVWWITDQMYVDLKTYYSPMGYDISNTWRFQLDNLAPEAPGYVPEEIYQSTEGDDLMRLQTQILQHPSVENVCISFYSAPYAFGNSWTQIMPVEGDTTYRENSFQCRYVSPEFFDLFRIKDIHGNSITSMVESAHIPVVVSEDMALKFFHTSDVRGRQLQYPSGDTRMTIAAVSVPYRDNEYKRSEPFFYKIYSGTDLKDFIMDTSVKSLEFCVRMKRHYSQEEINEFLKEMEDRLTVNNLTVYSVRSITHNKELILRDTNKETSKKMSLVGFLLINVLFGIIGTFWLRTQHRKAEFGLRVALGADQSSIRFYSYLEGIILLLLTVPLTLPFVLNIIFMDVPDMYRVPYSIGRFLITYSLTYVLMTVMICIGIWFPVRRVVKLAPAEALHYE